MEPTRIEERAYTLAGFSFFGDPFRLSGGWTEENEIGRLWQRFMAYLESAASHLEGLFVEEVAFEVHIYHQETLQTGEFEVFVGMEVQDLDGIPIELSIKILPPVTYAVFTLVGEQITADWSSLIYTGWLPESGYELVADYGIQRYDERYKGVDRTAESVLEFHVPVRPIPETG
jgi:predicted transcriptional regulator YdeE